MNFTGPKSVSMHQDVIQDFSLEVGHMGYIEIHGGLKGLTEKSLDFWMPFNIEWTYVTVHRKRDQLGQIMIVQYERF